MQYLLYFLITISATLAGSLTGMGGGVIIKPVLDVFGHYDAQTISVLSSMAVFSMAIVSVIRQYMQKSKMNLSIILPLSIGSIIGGYLGQSLLDYVIVVLEIGDNVVLIQNVMLIVIIVSVFIYMQNKSKIKSLDVKSAVISIIVGIFLGMISSFIGIGGGPINVALLIYVFSFDTKTATVGSIFTILFSQVSKLGTVMITTGFSDFDLSVAPAMIIGAIMGGFIGSKISKKLTDKQVDLCFNLLQAVVLLIAVYNVNASFIN